MATACGLNLVDKAKTLTRWNSEGWAELYNSRSRGEMFGLVGSQHRSWVYTVVMLDSDKEGK